MHSKNILVVDDEDKIVNVVAAFLEKKGYAVFCAFNGADALKILEQENILLVILDLMLPDISGERLCQIIRKKSRVPIIMLTAKVGEQDVLNGLALGADDYIRKPFSLKELYARVETVLRRVQDDLVPLYRKNSFGDGDLIVDFEKNSFCKGGQPIKLTPIEGALLSVLMKYPGKVFSREELIAQALGTEFDGYDRTIDSHIKNLRHKIEDNPRKPRYVLTIHGKGYRFGGE